MNNNLEKTVIDYYDDPDTVNRVVALAGGFDGLTAEKLSPYDEMHVGGHRATLHLLQSLPFKRDMRVLDIGCGIGGAARTVAAHTGAHVTGIDLTPGFCLAATTLSELVGMGEQVAFEIANATGLRFTDATFDGAYSIHTAMNIADKAGFYREVFRVLKPGATFAVYDVMGQGADLTFPLPWATTAASSFVVPPAEVEALLSAAGFTIQSSESRRDFAINALTRLIAILGDERSAGRGADYPVRIRNLLAAIESGACAPHQIIAIKP